MYVQLNFLTYFKKIFSYSKTVIYLDTILTFKVFLIKIYENFMAVVAQLVRASVCGTEGRGFETRRSPNFKSIYDDFF